jgi:hypothetical protein
MSTIVSAWVFDFFRELNMKWYFARDVPERPAK